MQLFHVNERIKGIIKAIATLLIVCSPLTAFAAIAIDSSAAQENPTSPISYTVGSGLSNSILIVFCNAVSGGSITSATYNGVTMTGMSFNPLVVSAGAVNGYGFYLANPSSGTNSIALAGGATIRRCAEISYSGVDSIDAFATPSVYTSGTTMSTTITVPTTGDLVVVYGTSIGGGTISNNTNITPQTITFSVGVGDSGGTVSSGSYNQIWNSSATCSSGSPCWATQVSLKTFVAPPLLTSILSLVQAFWITQ